MEHTKGPWRIISGDGESQRRIIADSIACTIATVYFDPTGHKRGTPWNEANARLIAAAPELLEALRKLAKIATDTTKNLIAFDGANELDAAIDKAHRAISKAEGRAETNETI